MAMTLDYLFNVGLLTFVTGLETQFYYAVVALLLPLVFLLWPMRSRQQEQPIPWYDYTLSAITLIVGGYFVYNAVPILERGWAFSAPEIAIYASYAYWLLIIEAARRAGGLPIAIIAGVFSLYPLVADIVPGPIQAFPSTLEQTAMYHTMSTESIMGVPLQAFAGLVIGFWYLVSCCRKAAAVSFY
ncbi:hypothetical protein HORIV_34280 [Vreelandella olivaria]|uniref:Uncharacterized protein n=1 Tax=Vreelandella olivaria TaxID=390919 RepID=A0ABM7GK60_9GAMM|nr:hypothetical protein HORIV_34280 [Halomonas olivaria]